ncbi:MAG TPA: hypothetical protein PLI95_06910, partial [Polyangiaceae bacterium]|nr:hypothetical protein [Polyangiaceae bacterium]
ESRCPNCGTTRGEEHRCPFCRAIAEPEPDPVVRFRCPACGGPRIPAPGVGQRDAAFAHLKKARSANASKLAWKTSGAVTAGFGVLGLAIITGVFAIVSPPLTAVLAGYVLGLAPLAFGALAWSKAKGRASETATELDEAWFAAARGVLERRGMMRASELAEALRVDPAQAEQMLVRLASHDDIRSDVTEGGDLALSVRGARLRVAEPPAEAEPAEVPASSEESAAKDKAGL